jgi:replicative DNA helicase
MVAIYDNSGDFTLDFTPIPDAIPPQNIEIEERVLGGIFLDPACIHSLKSRLKPEHFYLSSHRQLYKACLAITKKGLLPDLLQVAAYLTDKNLLQEIGGRNKLANLVNCTVSATNIDEFAQVLIQKHARRELIKLGSDVTKYAYSQEMELEDVLDLVRRRTETAINLDAAKTQSEIIKQKHDRLISAIKHIHTTVPSPSERLMRMMYLGREFDLSIKFLEQLYMKSLVDSCSTLMTYEELKAAAGNSVREWLQQGLVPVGSSILLGADGGVGKTNLAYTLAKHMICGTNLGDFHSTGEKRRVLIYQGDEQPADTGEKLELMGYDDNDIGKHVICRYGWSFESISYLIKDVTEFKPHLIIFDSLSFGNRFSTFTENETEYARPILEINGILAEHRCSAIFIHHTNRDGGFRGATSIRNAVSEAWLLSAPNSQEATPYDRTLLIDKSRSRSSKKKYKMYFDPCTLEFQFLGEDFQQGSDTQDKAARDRILKFFNQNRNTRYESEEIAQCLNISTGHARRTLSDLSVDGLLSVQRRTKKPNLYYISYDSPDGQPPVETELLIRGLTPDHLDDQQRDQLDYPDTASNPGVTDHLIIENAIFEKNKNKNFDQKMRSDDQQLPEQLVNKGKVADHRADHLADHADHLGDHGCDPSPRLDVLPIEAVSQMEEITMPTPIQQSLIPNQEIQTQTEPLQQIRKIYNTCLGQVKAMAEETEPRIWRFTLIPPVGTKGIIKTEKIGASKPENKLKNILDNWLKLLTFEVFRTDGQNNWVGGCKWVESVDHHNAMQKRHKFISPDGTLIDAFGFGCDRIKVTET